MRAGPAGRGSALAANTAPIYVIGGYLGSGKTTLLKRLLGYELDLGRTPAVLMNEFGEADVDGTILHDHARGDDLELRALLNGCACCDLSADLQGALRSLLDSPATGSVFIETTGLADTGRVADHIRNALAERLPARRQGELRAVATVIDTPRFAGLLKRSPEVLEQLGGVDTFVLNKLDEADDRATVTVAQTVRRTNPNALVFLTSRGELAPPEFLSSPRPFAKPVSIGAAEDGVDTTSGYTSLTVRVLAPLDLGKLEATLRRFKSVVRVKGFVRVAGAPGLHQVQWVPLALEAQRHHGRPFRPHLVLIGHRAPWERFLTAFDECAGPPVSRARA